MSSASTSSSVVPDTVVVLNSSKDMYPMSAVEWNSQMIIANAGVVKDDSLTKVIETVNTPHNYGQVNVKESTDVHLGNKTYIHGPVTINQFIRSENSEDNKNSEQGPEANGNAEGIDNSAFVSDKDEATEEIVHKFIYIRIMKNHILNHKKMYICGILFVIFSIISIVYMATELTDQSTLSSNNEDLVKNEPIITDLDQVLILSKKLRMISRKEWLAQPPSGVLDDMKLPSHNVIIAHSATDFCKDQASCTFQVRYIQTFHIESRSWSDIGYNFMVGGDGSAYECRGWDKVGAHTKGYNVDSIGIGLIGTFNTELPTKRQLLATKQLIELGVSLGKLDKNYKLYGHRQLIPSLSPGSALFAELKTWPHFVNISEIPTK